MKKTPVLVCLMAAMSLSGCALLKKLEELTYKDLETFFSENSYTRSDSADEFNKTMQEHVFVWSEHVRTYTNTGNSSTISYSPRGDEITRFNSNNQITVCSKFGEEFVILTDATETSTLIRYKFEEQNQVLVKGNLGMYYLENNVLEDMDAEHQHLLRVYHYDIGNLFVSSTDFMFFLTHNNQNVYLCVDNTSTFSNSQGVISLPSSDLLNETLAKYQPKTLFNLPLPSSLSNGVYHKDYINQTDGEWAAYDVILPYIDIFDYVNLIKQSGLEIYRGENHPLTQLGGERGGEWIFYDQNHEARIHLQDESPIAVTKKDSNNYGVRMRVQRAEDKFSYYGCSVNTQTDWTSDEKSFMSGNYGLVLPFINLGRRYHVVTNKRDNGENALDSALAMDVQCYWIFDNFYKDVITETYGQKLVEAGFRQYVPPVSSHSDSNYSSWLYSNEYVLYECYLYEDAGIAVKFSFDDIYGNTIRIFNISDMQAWWVYAD